MMAILLRNFVERSIPRLGIEPAVNVARAAQAIGVQTRIAFFGKELALGTGGERSAKSQISIIGNNVFGAGARPQRFCGGPKARVEGQWCIDARIPASGPKLIAEKSVWDTIYHEHFFLFHPDARSSVSLKRHGLRVSDVEQL